MLGRLVSLSFHYKFCCQLLQVFRTVSFRSYYIDGWLVKLTSSVLLGTTYCTTTQYTLLRPICKLVQVYMQTHAVVTSSHATDELWWWLPPIRRPRGVFVNLAHILTLSDSFILLTTNRFLHHFLSSGSENWSLPFTFRCLSHFDRDLIQIVMQMILHVISLTELISSESCGNFFVCFLFLPLNYHDFHESQPTHDLHAAVATLLGCFSSFEFYI